MRRRYDCGPPLATVSGRLLHFLGRKLVLVLAMTQDNAMEDLLFRLGAGTYRWGWTEAAGLAASGSSRQHL